jgi:hypothetical protein
MMEEMNSAMTCCKNFYKCDNVPQHNNNKKIKQNIVKKNWYLGEKFYMLKK